MKILAFSTYFLPYLSGAVVYPQKLFAHLSEKHHAIEVFTFRYDRRLTAEETIDGVAVTRLNYWLKISKGFLSWALPFQIWRPIRRSDLVFLNQPTFEGLAAAIWAFFFKKPIVSLYHCRVSLKAGLIDRLAVWGLNLSVALQLFLSEIIVATSEDYVRHDRLLRRLRKKLVVIPPPAAKSSPGSDYYRQLRQLKGDRIWVGYAGRIAREKGLEYLLKALVLLKKSFPKAVLVLAGPHGEAVAGEGQYYREIKNRLERSGLSYRFFGRLGEEELAVFYQVLDVFVLPSVNSTEAFGISQVEAILAGTPVVVSDLPGLRVPVSQTGMGLLAQPKDPVDLADKIERLLRHKIKIPSAQLDRISRSFDISVIGARWEKLLSELVNYGKN